MSGERGDRPADTVVDRPAEDMQDAGEDLGGPDSGDAATPEDGGSKRAAGAACTAADQCADGFCVDGVCCRSACAAQSCSGATETGAGRCNAQGVCMPGMIRSCGAYSCGPAACRTSCSGAGDCNAGHACVASSCVACTPESDAMLCQRQGKTCGSLAGTDNCGGTRTVASCGSCPSPQTCGGDGTPGVCGANAPPCHPAYAQASCTSYSVNSKVSNGGRNWTCNNGNCANCATYPQCAPGVAGCPWGAVWTDNGPCQ